MTPMSPSLSRKKDAAIDAAAKLWNLQGKMDGGGSASRHSRAEKVKRMLSAAFYSYVLPRDEMMQAIKANLQLAGYPRAPEIPR
jgi:hypothetical protein